MSGPQDFSPSALLPSTSLTDDWGIYLETGPACHNNIS